MCVDGRFLTANALSLQEARNLAEEHYPLVRDYGLIALTEQYTVENAAKAWLPSVTVGAQATWQTAVASYPDVLKDMLNANGLNVKGTSKLQYKATVEVNQMIYDGGRIKAQDEITRAESREAAASNDVELYRLRERVDGLYFGILLMEEQLGAVNLSIEVLQSNLDKVNTLVLGGAAMQSDADAVAAELLSTRQQAESLRVQIESYRAVLAIFMGVDTGYSVVEPPEVIVPESDDASARPEMRLFEARQLTLDARDDEVKASLRPRIGAFAQGSYGYPGLNFMESMMSRTPQLSAVVGVSATWDITPFYTSRRRYAIIAASRERIDVARDVFLFNTSMQAQTQRYDLRRLQAISADDDEIIELRARVRRASEAQLREGVVDPTQLLLRINEEKNARIAARTHRIEYLQAIYALLNTLNI